MWEGNCGTMLVPLTFVLFRRFENVPATNCLRQVRGCLIKIAKIICILSKQSRFLCRL
jgi:hypothetical protein